MDSEIQEMQEFMQQQSMQGRNQYIYGGLRNHQKQYVLSELTARNKSQSATNKNMTLKNTIFKQKHDFTAKISGEVVPEFETFLLNPPFNYNCVIIF